MTGSEHFPVVTVVVPVFNRLNLLRATVSSLKAQTLQEAEFLMIDDRSTDETWEYLTSLSFEDKRFRVIRKSQDVPRGCQSSRNLGIDAATASFIVFLDSDDLLAADCLAVRAEFLKRHPDIDIAVGSQAIFNEASCQAHWVNVPKTEPGDLDRFLALANPLDVPWVNGGCMLRLASLKEKGVQWREEFHWDDVVFHLDCLLSGMKSEWMERTEVPDSWYRLHGSEHYGSTLKTAAGLENVAEMFRWLVGRLKDSQLMSESRRFIVKKSMFFTCILPAMDLAHYDMAMQFCRSAGSLGLLTRAELVRVFSYITARRFCHSSKRLRYYVNRLARRYLIRRLFAEHASTYCTDAVDPGFCAEFRHSVAS
jgi:glycosyltransferase involved in cell wall biosynthesis